MPICVQHGNGIYEESFCKLLLSCLRIHCKILNGENMGNEDFRLQLYIVLSNVFCIIV